MKFLPAASLLTLTVTLGACASSAIGPNPGAQIAQDAAALSTPDYHRETVLLVSLEDGTIIRQTINSGADVCFKKNWDSATTCLTQGDPVVDPVTNAVIGFEMIEDHIELVAKTD